MQNSVHYFYLRNSKCAPLGCVAWQINEETKVITFGHSLCAKNDTFDRALARKIAAGRLLKSRDKSSHSFTMSTNSTLRSNVMKEIMSYISFNTGNAFHRNAVELANVWLTTPKKNQLTAKPELLIEISL